MKFIIYIPAMKGFVSNSVNSVETDLGRLFFTNLPEQARSFELPEQATDWMRDNDKSKWTFYVLAYFPTPAKTTQSTGKSLHLDGITLSLISGALQRIIEEHDLDKVDLMLVELKATVDKYK